MSNEKPVLSEEQRREALEKALAKVKPMVEERKKDASVYDRLQKFANRPDEAPHKEKEVAKDKAFSVYDLTEAMNKNAKESEKIGLQQYDMPEKLKEKTKENEKTREKERDVNPFMKDGKKSDEKDDRDDKDKEKEEKDPVKKQEEKMKEMFSKVTLPSGMEIHQEGPQWVLVSKDGKQRTDVTDVMNTIDKYNKEVDAVNEENRMQNEAQSSVDKAADVNKKEEDMVNGGTEDKVAVVSDALPEVKDVNGNQVFKPEDMEEIAKTALSASDEKALLERLADPKMLEEMEERERKNNKHAEEEQKKENNTANFFFSKQNERM